MRNKLVMLDLVVYLNRTPMFEWFVVWYESKNGYQKDLCDHLMSMRMSHFDNEEDIHNELQKLQG